MVTHNHVSAHLNVKTVHRTSSPHVTFSAVFVTLVLFTLLEGVSGQQHAGPAALSNNNNRQNNNFNINNHVEKVCPTTDIRNDPNMFAKLSNCTVIEGHLQILLIDYAEPAQYADLQFPALVEITDYLLLYRVYGLRTLAHIFPNLAVIRGQNLFFNYALVAFEMPDIEELGLSSLTTIKRGAVRLEKNPNLCYIDTIHWQTVTQSPSDDNIIMMNKDSDKCPNVCPHQKECTKIIVDSGRKQSLCWNSDSCQIVCPSKCPGPCYVAPNRRGYNETRCCHEECLGGCRGPENTDCMACKHVSYNGRCQKRCLYGTYKFLDRRCITETECRNMHDEARLDAVRLQWKVFAAAPGDDARDGGGELRCVEDCPGGYITDSHDVHKCVKCQGPCPKPCPGILIDSVAAAQKLRGCTRILGILEIQIRGGSQGHIGRELEENLSHLEEVTHYVKIVRSYSSVSLLFLKNLKVIHGERLHSDRYALFVLDNQNLVEIWNFTTHPPLTIKKGKMFFMFNRKLCLNKINQLVDFVGLRNVTTDEDIDPNTNGDQVACDTSHLTLEVVTVKPKYAVIRWNNFHTPDHRELLNWVVYYREAPQQNITIFNARDACGSDGWHTDDVSPDMDMNATYVASILYKLNPATQYAVYVQTYTIASANSGAISPIVYLTTEPSVPSPARDVKVTTKHTGEMHVSWKPPSKPNGNVTHYFVYWQPQALNTDKFDKRDYCVDKLRLPRTSSPENPTNKSQISGECCACPKTEEEQRLEESERELQIEFENFLQNAVYIKRPTFSGNYMDISLDYAPLEEQGEEDDDFEELYEDYSEPIQQQQGPPLGGMTDSSDGQKRKKRALQRILREAAEGKKLPQEPNDSAYSGYFENLTNHMNLSAYEKNNGGFAGFEAGGGGASNHIPYEEAIVYGKLEVTLTNLKHFQEYSVEVIACHELMAQERQKLCSNRAITTARTLPHLDSDNIPSTNISASNHSMTRRVWLRWLEPPEPNGIIITYDVELLKTDVANYKADIFCIPHKAYREHNGYLTERLNPGNWSFRIRAMSLAGNGSWTPTLFFYVANIEEIHGLSLGLTIGLPVAVILILTVIFTSLGVVYIAKRRTELTPSLLYTSVNPEYWSGSEVYVADHWEVCRDDVQIVRELGQGSFGMVYEGIAKDIKQPGEEVKIAIKTVNEKASLRDRIEFLNEASVMKAFCCNHVVRLMGVVSKGQPTLVIMELMANGDLKSYLRIHRPDCEENDGRTPPTLKLILQMAGEIADGMSYLAAKKFVHRDLAARNCMVSETGVVKIGDFGMTRDIYETDYYRKGDKGLLPVRWMAPESLRDGVFTSQSDVWSYGVVLWEMATLAHQPYQGLSNEQVLKYVTEGGLMEKPDGCPERLDDLMIRCWEHSPKKRPTFCEIIELLIQDLNPSFKDVSFFFSEENHQPVHCETDQLSHVSTGGEEDEEEYMEGDAEDEMHELHDIHTPLTASPAPSPRHHHHNPPPHYHSASSLAHSNNSPPLSHRQYTPHNPATPHENGSGGGSGEVGGGGGGGSGEKLQDARKAWFQNGASSPTNTAPNSTPPPAPQTAVDDAPDITQIPANGLANGHVPHLLKC